MMKKENLFMLGIATLGLSAGVALGLTENRVVETDAAAIYLNISEEVDYPDVSLTYWGGTSFYFDSTLEDAFNPFLEFDFAGVSSFVFTMDFGVGNLVADLTTGSVYETYLEFSYIHQGESKIYLYAEVSQGTPVSPVLIYSSYSGWYPAGNIFPVDGKFPLWINTDYQSVVSYSPWNAIKSNVLPACTNLAISKETLITGEYSYYFFDASSFWSMGYTSRLKRVFYRDDTNYLPLNLLEFGSWGHLFVPLYMDFDYLHGSPDVKPTCLWYLDITLVDDGVHTAKHFVESFDLTGVPWLVWFEIQEFGVSTPLSYHLYFKGVNLPVEVIGTGGGSGWFIQEDFALDTWDEQSWLRDNPSFYCYSGIGAYNVSVVRITGWEDYLYSWSYYVLSEAFPNGYMRGYDYAVNNYYAVNAEYQNLIYTNGYNYGWNVGYNAGLEAGQEGEGFFLGAIVKSVVDVPINVLNGLAPLAVFDTPIIGIVMSIMMTLVAVVIVKKVIK